VENPAGKTQQLTPFNILSALSFTAAGLVVYAILFSFHFALRFAGNLICCCLLFFYLLNITIFGLLNLTNDRKYTKSS